MTPEEEEKPDALLLWEPGLPPPAPDADLVTRDRSCQGTLGVALQHALDELQASMNCSEINGSDTGGAAETTTIPALPLHLLPTVVDRILHSFGEAVASSQRANGGACCWNDAPAALLRGRLDHYNRRNNKWRLVVQDAELRERYPLERNRRKRERPSLWQVAEEQQQARRKRSGGRITNEGDGSDGGPVLSGIRLEILAYNDVE